MEYDTAGDPITGLKWSRKTTAKIAAQLHRAGIPVSPTTVRRLLHDLDYSLRVNHKMIATDSSPDRDLQFDSIRQMRQRFLRHAHPIISVDSKKRELVGNFKSSGAKWDHAPLPVNDHDFRSDAVGIAILYGIYDLAANRGSLFVGVSHDTATFAVRSIAQWWRSEGCLRYPHTQDLLILADTGGSNSSRCAAWKDQVQKQLCDRFTLTLTVAHYPTGASKWNPIEHRLFSEISKNWAGEPLTSYEKILKFIRTTKTETGLRVRAYLDKAHYPTQLKVSRQRFDQLNLTQHKILPKWNYTLTPKM